MKTPSSDLSITLEFGGGVHSRAAEDKIDVRECSSGQNFSLDLQDFEFKNRKPFDLVGTVPNAAEIRGFATLLKSDGTVSFLVQAGATVYEWDGTNFTSKGTVSATAKLRGRLEHNWQLSDKVIITDINLQQPVMEWDGTTLQNISFFKNDASAAWTGSFKAKYCYINNERAEFFNVDDNGSAFPHLIVGSMRGDYTIISNNQRPSSSLSEEDAFFLIQPDYHPINGAVGAFGKIVTSSDSGSLFILEGYSAQDFIFSELYPRSGADGDESLVYIGNDIVYGRQGAIESVTSTSRFGDVETNDLSQGISDQIGTFAPWVSVYNSRTQRAHFFPDSQNEMWTLHKPLLGSKLSPWIKNTTLHSSAFQPTAVMNMLDPSDSLEYVFFGDSSGNMYRLEGTGSGDGGTKDVHTERTSKLFSAPLDAEAYEVYGEIKYRKSAAQTVYLTLLYAGMNVFDETITIDLPANTTSSYYGGGAYYGGSFYYGAAFRQRLTRQKFGFPGRSNEFQVRAVIEGSTDFTINSIILRLKAVA
ncbi:MAG: hypothetical protein ACE5DX_05830 [Candidatus Dojkabacteria bacterium]